MRLDAQFLVQIQRITSCSVLGRVYSTAQPHHKEKLKYKYPKVKQEYPPGRWDKENIKPKVAWQVHEEEKNIKLIPKVIDRLEHIAGEEDYRFFYMVPGRNYSRARLEYEQFLTNTHFASIDSLPEVYKSLDSNKYSDRAKSLLEQSLDMQKFQYRNFDNLSQTDRKYHLTQATFKQLLGSLLPEISSEHKHLWTSQLDENVTTQAFWDRGAFVQKDIDGNKLETLRFRNPNDLSIKFAVIGETDFQLRTEDSLPEVTLIFLIIRNDS